MDDVIDRRTRLIYASLADHELVRQLEEAHRAATQHRRSRAHALPAKSGRHRALGTRPWVPAPSAAPALPDDDLVNADVTTSGETAPVIDLRSPAARTTTGATAATHVLVGRQQSSECATDDPSYYLG